MFLPATKPHKDGKDHRDDCVVENQRLADGRRVQKTRLTLGEINDSQKEPWVQTIDAIEERHPRQLSLFPQDRPPPEGLETAVQIRLWELPRRRPRQWGAGWLACHLWRQLHLDEFWQERLAHSRKGTQWTQVWLVLVAYRLIDPGSEWRLHRTWFDHSAMADLLGSDFRLAQKDTLTRCHDLLLAPKEALFAHLTTRWEDLFGVPFEGLLYDLTSTDFESDPPFEGKRQFGDRRDKRSDCVPVVIALVVSLEGFALAYEVMAGHTADTTPLRGFLKNIQERYGQAQRIWVMDRGIPTEEVLQEMREASPPISSLVGTPKARWKRYEKRLLPQPWHTGREDIQVKLLPEEEGQEVYIYAQSQGRIAKERALRLRRVRKLLSGLRALRARKTLTRDTLLRKLGVLKKQAGRLAALVDITLPAAGQKVTPESFHWKINREKYRQVYRREGRYLLRSHLSGDDPAHLWRTYIQLTPIEEAFGHLKGDLGIRPIYHRVDSRIEAPLFVSFLAYCLHVTLSQRCRQSAGGLTARSVLEQLKAMQMIDVKVPTVDGRLITLPRYTQPDKAQQMILAQLHLELPSQPPPRITPAQFQRAWGEDL